MAKITTSVLLEDELKKRLERYIFEQNQLDVFPRKSYTMIMNECIEDFLNHNDGKSKRLLKKHKIDDCYKLLFIDAHRGDEITYINLKYEVITSLYFNSNDIRKNYHSRYIQE